mmetsp:Transcript_7021/g.11796  ORF Transcript_7021/g.11796 Transcript_7021/m.11796 type:complete len:91 (-) Transcript_7021:1615-1887(-)
MIILKDKKTSKISTYSSSVEHFSVQDLFNYYKGMLVENTKALAAVQPLQQLVNFELAASPFLPSQSAEEGQNESTNESKPQTATSVSESA